ncbi:PREDICTED: uncharacterized protein LOC109346217 isoform X2 [Lupinus angustifolius]|uniref:uncharacterized protein LOC109346217 isoform X2 n=1 Tax=Lupinus angustifolius TaxID=3871 RepID=UPI00092FAC2D|nr:PREDICTED: uncharacterized protein LOC109346217 isoform X2 [Lupinus angustifolius]
MDLLQPTTTTTTTNNLEDEPTLSPYYQDFDSTCSTPYVSAPSSPAHAPPIPGYYYSAPASPMHFSINTSSSFSSSYQNTNTNTNTNTVPSSDFEFSARFGSTGSGGPGLMSSADELFLNGQIRPMKLSTHLEKPQLLSPLLDLEEGEEHEEEEQDNEIVVVRGRDLRLRDKSMRRRTRSMSPLRNNTHLEWIEKEDNKNNNDSYENERDKVVEERTIPCASASSSRSSSAGRSSKRWIFLKDFLRSKSEGRSNNKFWSTISFSPTTKEKKTNNQNVNNTLNSKEEYKESQKTKGNGNRKRPSLHELHYKANRAQAEELRKKTFLPYRQGLLGCLGFSSKGYGAMNGFARALNPVSSR